MSESVSPGRRFPDLLHPEERCPLITLLGFPSYDGGGWLGEGKRCCFAAVPSLCCVVLHGGCVWSSLFPLLNCRRKPSTAAAYPSSGGVAGGSSSSRPGKVSLGPTVGAKCSVSG